MIRIRTNVAKRWQRQIREASTPLTVLSPYITRNKTLDRLAKKRATFYTRFEVRDFVSKASTLAAFRLLLDRKCKIYEVKNLHAKVIMDQSSFVTLGSQNLTFNGATRNLELSVCFDGESRTSTCERVREVVNAWADDPKVVEIDWERLERMEADVERAKEAFEKYESVMNEIQSQADEFQSGRLEAVVAEKERARVLLKAANHAAMKKAVQTAEPSNIFHTGTIEEPANAAPRLKFKSGVDLYEWGRPDGPLPKNSRCLCLLDEEHLGWVRLAGKQFTRIARQMVIGKILPSPFQDASVTLSVDDKDLRKTPTPTNVVAKIDYRGESVCKIAMAYSIKDLKIQDVAHPPLKVNGKKPKPIQLLRVKLIEWIKDSEEDLVELLKLNIASTSPLPKLLDGEDASDFMGPAGTKVEVTMKFTGRKKRDPILLAKWVN